MSLPKPLILTAAVVGALALIFGTLNLFGSGGSTWAVVFLIGLVLAAFVVAAAIKAPQPVMTVAEGSSPHRTFQLVGWGLFTLMVVLSPFVLESFRIKQLNQSLYFMVGILGVNLIIGYSGLISLGNGAFMGIGAMLCVILVEDEGWNPFATLLIILPICFVAGLIVGFPALKIKGLYLALVTLALGYTFPLLLKIDQWGIAKRTGGANGRSITVKHQLLPPKWFRDLPAISHKDDSGQVNTYRYILLVVIAAIVFLLVRNLIKSRAGRAIIAIRDNQTGAAVSGVPLSIFKVVTFGISAMVAGLAGMMFAMVLDSAGETSFGPGLAITLLVGLVLGGVGTLQGAVVGGLAVVFVDDLRTRITLTSVFGWKPGFFQIERGSPLTQAIFGLILMLVAFFAPGGVVAASRKIKAKLIRVVPNPPEPVPGMTPPVELAPAEKGTLSGVAQ